MQFTAPIANNVGSKDLKAVGIISINGDSQILVYMSMNCFYALPDGSSRNLSGRIRAKYWGYPNPIVINRGRKSSDYLLREQTLTFILVGYNSQDGRNFNLNAIIMMIYTLSTQEGFQYELPRCRSHP